LPDWKRELVEQGIFDLVIQDEARTGPTQAQERSFVHFQENHNVICPAVVAATFEYDQEEYKNRESRLAVPDRPQTDDRPSGRAARSTAGHE
jgi:hypothetical protein